VPPQKGVGGNEEATPTCPREQSAQRSKDRSICGPVPDTSAEPTFEDAQLVPQHDDLDVLVRLGPTARDNEAEESAHPEVQEGEDHDG
jgi:hypothetical protein